MRLTQRYRRGIRKHGRLSSRTNPNGAEFVKNKLRKICVYCGASSGHASIHAAAARLLGTTLANQQISLVYGGGRVGLMGIVADAVMNAGGHVIGVIPKALMDTEVGHQHISQLLIVKDMHERKALMAEHADAFIALPGGLGTLEELFETLTWAQLGFHEKPIGLLNVNGFYNGLVAFIAHQVREGFVREEHARLLFSETDASALIEQLQSFEMPEGVSWLSRQAARTLGP
ncbi:COG1611 Predicted Rossmann fold nucleotide-binding protein [Oxalobacteraceae bacterium]